MRLDIVQKTEQPLPLELVELPRQRQQPLRVGPPLLAARLRQQPRLVAGFIEHSFEALRQAGLARQYPPVREAPQEKINFRPRRFGGYRRTFTPRRPTPLVGRGRGVVLTGSEVRADFKWLLVPVKSSEGGPKVSSPLRKADRGELVECHTHERRAQHGQQRQVLHWVVEQLQQTQQIGDFQALEKTAARHCQRHAQLFKLLRVAFGLVARRPQQNRHVAPFHRPELSGVLVPNSKPAPQLAETQRRPSRFFCRVGKIGQVVLIVLAIFRLRAAGQTEMQFHSGRGIGGQREIFSFSRRTESQSLLLVVFHAADFLSHQRGKERINEIQNGLVTAEVVAQRNDLTGCGQTGRERKFSASPLTPAFSPAGGEGARRAGEGVIGGTCIDSASRSLFCSPPGRGQGWVCRAC